MYRDAVVLHSKSVGDDIDLIVYGEKGYPVIVFQTQNSPATNYEDFGMVDELSSYINDGKIQLFSVGNIDAESWMATDKDKSKRSQRQEDYFKFVTDELVPYVHECNNSELRPLTTGCALGATHAAIAVMRRPDLFQGCIALSGVYRTSFYYGDWMDSNLYLNDIIVSLRNLPQDHPYVNLYNHLSWSSVWVRVPGRTVSMTSEPSIRSSSASASKPGATSGASTLTTTGLGGRSRYSTSCRSSSRM